jgi:hypothetical protein
MPESESWAIATQQSHALGKSPKGYGTSEGRHTAKAKYDTPGDDVKAAKGSHNKEAGLFRAVAPILNQEQDDRMRQIIREELNNHAKLNTHTTQSSHKMKAAHIGHPLSSSLINGFSDEMKKIKIARLAMSTLAAKPTTIGKVTSGIPRNTLSASTPRYSQVNPATQPGPASQHQPVLSPPPVRG